MKSAPQRAAIANYTDRFGEGAETSTQGACARRVVRRAFQATRAWLTRSKWPVTALYYLAVAGLLFLFQAGSVFGHGGFHERIEALTEAVKKAPSDPLLRFELANLHGQHGDLKLALENLDRVDALAPGKYLTDLLRGAAFLVAREFAKAKEALDRQLVSHPESARAWLLRARAEGELRQQAASLADYREGLKRTTSPEPDLIQEVSAALAAAGKKEEAAAVLAAGIERLGNIPSLVLRALDLEIETKNFEAALRRIEQARHDAPRPEPWMARRAAVLAQAGRIEESRAAWKALVEHLDSLPAPERTSRAMSKLKKEAGEALASLKSSSATEPPPSAEPNSVAEKPNP